GFVKVGSEMIAQLHAGRGGFALHESIRSVNPEGEAEAGQEERHSSELSKTKARHKQSCTDPKVGFPGRDKPLRIRGLSMRREDNGDEEEKQKGDQWLGAGLFPDLLSPHL